MNKYNILDKLGMNCGLKGYIYWQKSIEIVLNNKDYILNKFNMMLIYEKLANIFDSTPSKIERAMRYARQKIYNLQEKMNVDYKIKNNNFLAYLIKEIK